MLTMQVMKFCLPLQSSTSTIALAPAGGKAGLHQRCAQVMKEPCNCSDGYTYERAAIALWLQGHNSSPMTNITLASKDLVPNLPLRSAIRDWLARTGQAQ